MNDNLSLPGIEWTDGNLQCMYHQSKNQIFAYAEVRIIAPESYVFCTEEIDISDYSEKEINDIITTYYLGGIQEIMSTYHEKTNQIIAECIFESLQLEEMSFISISFSSEDEAASALEKYIQSISH